MAAGNGVISALGVELAVIDAVGSETGHGSLSATAKEELAAAEARAAGLIGPAVAWALALCLAKFGLDGVALDQDEPFSDASLSGALAAVLGVPVASVKNREALKDAFRRAVTLQVSQAVGVPFSDVFDRSALRVDALRAVGVSVQRVVPGLVLRDLSDRGQTVHDVAEYSRLVVSDALGINFTDLSSAHAIKEDVYAWAMPQIRQMVDDEQAAGAPYKGPLKMDKKSIRNREAQRRYRQKWGSLRKYKGLNNG